MKEEALEFLQKLLRIKSINPPGDERAVALEIKALLGSYDIEAQVLDFAPGRANLVATLRGQNGGASGITLGISGHMDVVPPGQEQWSDDPFSPTVRDGKIFARGASDMKSGLVALIFAMVALQKENTRLCGNLKLLVTAGEEAGYADDLNALLIGEPTIGEVVHTHKGALGVESTCHGKTAHGARPHLGINAILHMTKLLTALSSDRFKMRYVEHPVLGGPTINIGVVRGGVKVNMVPDRCAAEIDIRTVPSQNHAEILKEIIALVESLRHELPDLRADVRVTNDLPSVTTPADHPFVHLVKEAVTQVLGTAPSISGMAGYTDAAVFVAAKPDLPVVILGPGDPRLAHQPDEYVEIDRFLRFIDVYKSIFVSYLGT